MADSIRIFIPHMLCAGFRISLLLIHRDAELFCFGNCVLENMGVTWPYGRSMLIVKLSYSFFFKSCVTYCHMLCTNLELLFAGYVLIVF
jgi:hypothetical protein